MSFNLADVLNQIAGQNSDIQQNASDISSAFSRIQTAGEQKVSGLQQAGADEVIKEQVSQQGMLQAQENTVTGMNKLGTNLQSPTELITVLTDRMNNAGAQARAALNEVQQKKSVGLFDDPLQWVMNQITLPDSTAKYNAAAEVYNEAESELQGRVQESTSLGQMERANAQTSSAASISAAIDIVKQKTDIAVAAQQVQNDTFNIQGIHDVQAAGQAQIDNSIKVLTLKNSAESMAMERESMTMRREEFALNYEMKQREMLKSNSEAESDKALVDTINRGRAVMNLPALPYAKIIALTRMGGTDIKNQFIVGSNLVAGGDPNIAPTAAQSALMIASNRAPLAPTQQALRKVLVDGYNTVMSNPQIDKKDTGAVTSNMELAINNQLAIYASNIKVDPHNPYSAPDLATLARLKSVQTNPLYTSVLKPMIENGNLREVNPEQILNLAVDAVKKGTIPSINVAADAYSALFRSAAANNNATKGFKLMGVAPQNSYKVTISDSKVNALNPNQVAAKMIDVAIGAGLGTEY